jgi:hypothetical protein
MVYYGKILKAKERDNPNPFCRSSYIFSNVGQLVYCWGRTMRFPYLKEAYLAEMKLALGDVFMQCELSSWEIDSMTGVKASDPEEYMPWKQDHYTWADVDEILAGIATHASRLLMEPNFDKQYFLQETLAWCVSLCYAMKWSTNEIRHLGFIHVCERFEQFEKEGWK